MMIVMQDDFTCSPKALDITRRGVCPDVDESHPSKPHSLQFMIKKHNLLRCCNWSGTKTTVTETLMDEALSVSFPLSSFLWQQIWNPGFDVAPAPLITGIITERGMVPKQGDAFQVRVISRTGSNTKVASSRSGF